MSSVGELPFLQTKDGATEVAAGVYMLGAQGNALMVRAGGEVLVVDSGPGGRKTAGMIAAVRDVTDEPVSTIVYSHGHVGYNAGVQRWFEHNAERGEPPPRVIVCAARFRAGETLSRRCNSACKAARSFSASSTAAATRAIRPRCALSD